MKKPYFSIKKVVISGFVLAGSIYAIYTGVEAVTQPPSYDSLTSFSTPEQPKQDVAVVSQTNPARKGLAFLEMPVYPENLKNVLATKTEKPFSYNEYQEKSQEELKKVFTAMREAGNWCFNQWPVGSFNGEQVEVQVGSYLGGCSREQLLKMASTVNTMFDMSETASSIQAYQLVAAALEQMPGETNKERRETYHRLEEITLARDAAMSNEYAALDKIYSSQCEGNSKSQSCEAIKSRIVNYLNLPSDI